MTKQKKNNTAPPKGGAKKGESGKTKQEIAELTALVKKMSRPANPQGGGGSNKNLSPWGQLAIAGGNALGSMFGVPKIFGSGAYKMSGGNTSWDAASQVPIMHSDAGKISFAHREYIGQLSSSSAFTVEYSEVINPANSVLFPYLSGIAGSFQEYRFKGLAFEYKSTSADALNSTNTALGTVELVIQYRSDAAVPAGKMQMMNEMWSVSCKPSESIAMPVECAPKEAPTNVLYIGTGTSAANDPKFYNLGRLVVATSGSQAASDIGELWVTYDVELYKPLLAQSSGPSSATCAWYQGLAATTALPIGTSGIYASNNLTMVALNVSSGVLGIALNDVSPGAYYMVTVSYTGGTVGGNTSASIAFNAVSGCVAIASYNGGATTQITSQSATGNTPCIAQYVLQASASGATRNMTLQLTVTAVSTTSVNDLDISAVLLNPAVAVL
jgi:hypothetical protein